MEPLFPNSIWTFQGSEEEITEDEMEFKIKWVMPKDKSKLFWEITAPEDEEFKQYASKLKFEVPSHADYNRIYCKGLIHIDDDFVAHFYCQEPEFQYGPV